MVKPINIFIIYAREDKEIKQRILAYLNPFVKPYNLNIWHDDHIEPGQEWKPHINSRLNQTDLFVMLVSIDFMNSKFINQVEFKYAVERHKAKESIVIPVIIDYCPWDIDFEFDDFTFSLSELQVLPDEAKPIGDWKTPEQAYNNVATGIRKVFISLKKEQEQQENIIWNQAIQTKNISSYNMYLEKFPNGKFSGQATKEISSLQQKEKEAFERNQQEIEKAVAESEKMKIEEEERQKQMEHDDEMFWNLAEEKNSIEGYQEYINKYSAGKYKSIALSVIRTLENITKKRKKDEEDNLWKSICNVNTIDSYSNYLEKTELGLYRDQAIMFITEIEKKNQEHLAEQERSLNADHENKLWDEVTEENNIQAYEKYLHTTTLGLFKEKALATLSQLQADQREKEIEQELWQKATTENTINSYRGYLQHCPNGMHSADVSASIKEIEEAERKQQEMLAKKENASALKIKKKRTSLILICIGVYLVIFGVVWIFVNRYASLWFSLILVFFGIAVLWITKSNSNIPPEKKLANQTDSAVRIAQIFFMIGGGWVFAGSVPTLYILYRTDKYYSENTRIFFNYTWLIGELIVFLGIVIWSIMKLIYSSKRRRIQ